MQQPEERMDFVNENLTLIQKTHGLTYGTDAFLLSAFVRKKPNAIAADFGSGTGIIALLCAARHKYKKIYAVEIQPAFSALIQRNAVKNQFDATIESVCMDVQTIKKNSFPTELDVVFTNPPYMRIDSGKRNEQDSKFIARHEVCGTIVDFCNAASRVLKFGGLFDAVYRPDRLTDLLCAMRNATLEPKKLIMVYPDANHAPCLVLVEAKKGAAPSIVIPKPLFLNSPQANEIYESGEFTPL